MAGASTGIGAALVAALTEDGHDARGFGRIVCDVRREDDVQFLCARLRDESPGLDALIVTAGTFGAIGRLPFTDSAAWEDAILTNVLGLYYLAKHGLPLLEQGTRPRLITFAGGGAFGAFPRYSAYATSKAAVVRLTECLAAECRPKGIAVNAIAPGMVDTPIHQQTMAAGAWRAGTLQFQKTLECQDGAGVPMAVPVDCVRWLLSPEADGITGRTIAAAFDPWRDPEFAKQLIADPALCTLRRHQLPDRPLDMRPGDEGAYA